jgi:hypothetical protein
MQQEEIGDFLNFINFSLSFILFYFILFYFIFNRSDCFSFLLLEPARLSEIYLYLSIGFQVNHIGPAGRNRPGMDDPSGSSFRSSNVVVFTISMFSLVGCFTWCPLRWITIPGIHLMISLYG